MSKTYKHQAKYDQKVFWKNYWPFGRIQHIYENGEWIRIVNLPPAKKQREPHPWYWHGVEANNKQEIEKFLQRRYRHKVKALIKKGEYDLLPLRPERSAWILF